MTDEKKMIVHIDPLAIDPELPPYDQEAGCPHCGGATETGFGMAGGGYGLYTFCPWCERVVSKSAESE
jgi:hypothetical protein